jgi:DNA polymerase-3 subunit delta'
MIVGHKKQWELLKQSLALNRISHAYLFSGQEKLGKKTIALEWSSLINDWEAPNKYYPDLILISPENGTIQIARIRELIWKLQLTPHSARLKVAIIDQAHLMGVAAQHALLKTLEEPRKDTLLILVTSKAEILLPTIRSRCEIIKFYPVPKIEIKNYLKNEDLPEEKAELIASIARGRPGEAIDFILDPQKLKKRNKATKELNKVLSSSINFRFQYAKSISRSEDLEEILGIWEDVLRENLLKTIKHPLAKTRYSPLKLKNIIESLQKINFLISTTNINKNLALENLMLQL